MCKHKRLLKVTKCECIKILEGIHNNSIMIFLTHVQRTRAPRLIHTFEGPTLEQT